MTSPAAQFKIAAGRVAPDLQHRNIVQTALGNYEVARDKRKPWFQDWQAARQPRRRNEVGSRQSPRPTSRRVRAKLEARGTKVHWASTGDQARDIILDILRDKKARSIIKSKAMTSEEIHLNEALEHAGFEVVESDLGEFIVQLRHEAPYHIVFPRCT